MSGGLKQMYVIFTGRAGSDQINQTLLALRSLWRKCFLFSFVHARPAESNNTADALGRVSESP